MTISSSTHPIAVVLTPFSAMSIPPPLAVGAKSGALRRACAVGLALAAGLTLASFGLVGNQFLWAPVLPVVLIVLAIAQMGVHLVFFLHISTGPDNSSNVMALAFGVLIVFLVVGGSLWIMANTNANMMPADMTKMSR